MIKAHPFSLPNTFLIIIGNVASGKSTATHILSKKLKLPVIEADTLFQTTNPYRKDFLDDMPRWALINELWMTVNRVEILSKFKADEENKTVLVDSGLLMSWVYTYAHQHDQVMSQRDWHLYQQVFTRVSQDFIQNIRVLHLDYSVPTLMERVATRGREYELKYYTTHYLTCLEQGISALLADLDKKHVPILHISEQEITDFEHNREQQKTLVENVALFIGRHGNA